MEIFQIEPVIGQIITLTVTAVFGACIGKMSSILGKERREREAQAEGIKCLLRAELVEKHRRYVIEGEHMRYYDRENLADVHRAYKGMNGNGLGDKLWNEIEALPLSDRDE